MEAKERAQSVARFLALLMGFYLLVAFIGTVIILRGDRDKTQKLADSYRKQLVALTAAIQEVARTENSVSDSRVSFQFRALDNGSVAPELITTVSLNDGKLTETVSYVVYKDGTVKVETFPDGTISKEDWSKSEFALAVAKRP